MCGGGGLPCGLTSWVDLRFVDFSVSSPFYLLLGWNNDFHVPYMTDEKLELHYFFNYSFCSLPLSETPITL